ncbi:Tfp pilus assembly protein FimT/FimU [Candidatus Omnitrophota bacterium]
MFSIAGDLNMHRQGFTLIELAIIIVVLGILAVTVLVSGTAKGPIRLEAACQRLAMDLRYMQEMAMAEQVRFGISFDTSDEAYFGYRINTSSKAKDPQTQGDLEVEFDEMREFNEIQIVSTNFSDAVEFDSIGAPYDGNGVLVSSEGIVTLTDDSNSKTVRIEPVTGKVSIQ